MTIVRHNEGILLACRLSNSVAPTELKYKNSLNPFEIPFLNSF